MSSEGKAPETRISQRDGLAYWENIPASVNGMLGGFPGVSETDMRGSLTFIAKLRRLHGGPSSSFPAAGPIGRAVDCGAGIGRVTAGVLLKTCAVVDVVEPVEKFAAVARDLAPSSASDGGGRIGSVYVTGLESWKPTEKYDLIWQQWCLGHLKDSQLVDHLQRCGAALRPGGWIVIKENMSTEKANADRFDELDSTVTRADKSFRRLFETSGLTIVRTELQKGFPKALYPVRFYALQKKS